MVERKHLNDAQAHWQKKINENKKQYATLKAAAQKSEETLAVITPASSCASAFNG
jgi:hypothetical protein